jgi:hypothetical protein
MQLTTVRLKATESPLRKDASNTSIKTLATNNHTSIARKQHRRSHFAEG